MAHSHPGHESHHPHESRAHTDADHALAAVTHIHGGAGPWAAAGYRMGKLALELLGVARGSFDLEVIHFTPRQVQYSCIVDGAIAATGASLGKLNVALADALPSDTRTLYRRRSTGAELTLRVTAAFAARFSNVPAERRREAALEVLALEEEALFEII